MSIQCFLCGNRNPHEVSILYGYEVCSICQSTLGLLKDNTIQKHVLRYAKARETVPENPSYSEDVDYRVRRLEEDYFKRRIKLLHIQERLKKLEK
jgi:hypothetical protein